MGSLKQTTRKLNTLLRVSFSSCTKYPTLTKFILKSPKMVELQFDNGKTFNLSSEFLRVQSPAADSKRRTVGGEKVVAGRQNVGIISVAPVGNYAIRIHFDDLHETGIYSWDYLYNLGENKFHLMRQYLMTLKRLNLSRSPSRRS